MITRELVRAIIKQYPLPQGGIHGPSHWGRVLENGRRLAQSTGAKIEVVELFAVFHDSQRHNDHIDPQHGLRGARFAASLCGSQFLLDTPDFELLFSACSHHTDGKRNDDITIQTCWDSDRLDLGRVHIQPNPLRLCTEAARSPEVIAWADSRSRSNQTPCKVFEEWGLPC
jgi:uncharacterized protein